MGSRTFFLVWVVVAIAISLPGCTDATRGGGTFGSVPDPDRSPFPNLIENGDFEHYDPHSKPALWMVDAAGPWVWVWDEFSAGAGRRSLFIDASLIVQASPTPKQGQEGPGWATAEYRLRDLKPDTAYILEISLFKDRNIDGVYPLVTLAGRTFRLSDLWGSGKWKRISLIFKTPPESGPVGGPPGANRILSIKIPAGDYRLWLDDLTLREFRIEIGREALPDRGAAVPISPGSIDWAFPATDRLIDFRVVLAASPARIDQRDPAAVVLETNNAAPSGGEAMGASASHVPVSNLDLAKISLKVGASVYFRVEASQYNKFLAVSKIGKIKIPPAAEAGTAAARAASGDATSASTQAQALLSPADFFPIGIYGAGLDDFEALRRAGFNTVVFAARSLASLDEGVTKAKKLGLKLIVSPDVFMGATDTTEKARSNPPLPHPPLPLDPVLAWYLDDEPEGRSVSPRAVRQKRDALRLLGFSQPGAIALCRSWRALDYASAADIFMSDPYPIPFEPISWISENLDEIRSVIGADPSKRVWAVIQAFGWNTDRASGAAGVGGLGRLPSPSELGVMTDLALAHGAQGIFFYTYRSGGYFLPDHADLWAAVKATVDRLNRSY